MPEPEGATVQVNEVVARAPALSCAVTVTVLAPAVVGVPVIVPELEIEVPAGSPVAVKAGVWPLVVSVADTGTDTAVPAMPSCGPGLAMVSGWPICAEETASVAGSGGPAPGTDTAVPAMPSCGPGLAMVSGWPICAEETASVPVSGRFVLESPTETP